MNGPSLGFLAPAASFVDPQVSPVAPPYQGAPLAPGVSPADAVAPPPPPPPAAPNQAADFLRGLAAAATEPSPAGPPPPPAPAGAPAPAATPPEEGGNDWMRSLYGGVKDLVEAQPQPEPSPVQAAATVQAADEAPAQDVQFLPVGGGASPAHESYMRGPQQDAHLMQSFEPGAQAAGVVDARIQDQAAREEQHYASLADQAMARQQGIEQAIVRRQQQLDDAMSAYQDSVKQLGTMHLDSNRWWADKSTGDKIGTAALAFLGGLGAGLGHGPNLAYDAINKKINDDIDTQKFDYQVGLDRAKGAQNSFAMLVQKFGSEDAAEAAARAAALDYAQAKTAQLASQWKGVDSANQATQLIAQLESEKQRTIANGFKFVPAQVGAPRYAVAVRGQVLPGTVSEAQAQNIALEHGVKPAEDVDKELVKGGVEVRVAGAKAAAEQQAKKQNFAVKLATGEVVHPPSEQEAGKLRDLVASTQNTRRLVAEAKKIRDNSTFRVDRDARARLSRIQAELLTDFGVQHQLGALSDKDYEIAQEGTANLFDIGSPVEARLDGLTNQAVAKIGERVNTYDTGDVEAPRAAGKMPGSFVAHGKK